MSTEQMAYMPISARPDPYLDLLKSCLTAELYPESGWQMVTGARAVGSLGGLLRRSVIRWLQRLNLMLVRKKRFDPDARCNGTDWPFFGYTMVGHRRLDNIHACIEAVVADGVPGDLIETGVWRGGTVILMKAILRQLRAENRVVWAADSFDGLPPPTHFVDRELPSFDLSSFDYMKVSLDQVRENFARFGLLDEGIRFLKGWFADTLPSAPIERLALLRLDGDMYESTRDALAPLYPLLSSGGFVVVDDYLSWPGCRKAVDEYRTTHGITTPIVPIDSQAVLWRKQ